MSGEVTIEEPASDNLDASLTEQITKISEDLNMFTKPPLAVWRAFLQIMGLGHQQIGSQRTFEAHQRGVKNARQRLQ